MSSVKLPAGRVPSVMRLLNSTVEFCLVYGIDETSTRELRYLGGRGEPVCLVGMSSSDSLSVLSEGSAMAAPNC